MKRLVGIIRSRIPLDKPWVLGALALAVLIMAYSGVVAYSYTAASAEIAATSAAIDQLRRTAPAAVPGETDLETELASATAAADEIRSVFHHPESDDLVAILSTTARAADVWVRRASIAERQREERDGVQYEVQSISVSLTGSVEDTYRFFSLLHQTAPVVDVREVAISEFRGEDQTTQATLVFYIISPQQTDG